MNDDDLDWLLRELTLTAERARDRGLTPAEFLVGLQTYGRQFMDEYSQATDD